MADKEKSGVKPSAYKDDVAPYVTVASGENSSSQEENLVKAGHDNLCDVNAGKHQRVAYPVVANYVRNTWSKFGLVKSMLNSSTGIFSYQFSSMDGLNAMLENGPWFIHNNLLILKKWNPNVNLVKEDVTNVSVWVKLHGVLVTAFSDDGLSAIITKFGTPLMLDSYTSDMCIQSWGRCACCKVFGHVHAECPKNTDSNVVKSMKKPSQAPRGVSVGPKVGFKLVKKVFRQVSKKNNVNTSGNKKKDADAEPTIKVSNSNLFDVLNSVENDVDLGTNGRTSNLASNNTNFGGSSSWNVEASSTNIMPIVDKIDKYEKLIIDGKFPLWMIRRDTYENVDYDYDPYDDNMYEGQEIPKKIQSICDNLDITVRGRKKK
uniref:DUF4283 domain-containing protein n=1 Tax=Tanacetum cinerariifolium TaxID=118510 RepID=A0A6L2NW95_TANCI|nr:hypothetical protein [Tanacetum cinerariifolium]